MIGLGEGSYLGRSRTYYDQNSPTVGGPVSWNVAEEGYLKKKPNRVLFFFFFFKNTKKVGRGSPGSEEVLRCGKQRRSWTKWWDCAAEVGKGQQQRTMGCAYIPNPAPSVTGCGVQRPVKERSGGSDIVYKHRWPIWNSGASWRGARAAMERDQNIELRRAAAECGEAGDKFQTF